MTTHAVDFIGIGAAKSASTWVFRCLIEHPAICGPAEKELKFFDNPHLVKRGLAYYFKQFPKCNKPNALVGEFSPAYMCSIETAKRIHGVFPHAKLIVVLRNPIEKVYSTYWSNKWGGRGSLSVFNTLEDALDHVPEMLENAMYGRQLRDYFSVFPKEQFHISFFEDIKKDPIAFMQSIYSFLGVDASFVPPSVNKGVNESGDKRIKYPFIFKMIYSVHWKLKRIPFFRKCMQHIDMRSLSIALAHFGVKRGHGKIEKPPMQEETREKLRQAFKNDIQLLSQLTGRDLSGWN